MSEPIGIILEGNTAPFVAGMTAAERAAVTFGASVTEASAATKRAMIGMVTATDDETKALASQKLAAASAMDALSAYGKEQQAAGVKVAATADAIRVQNASMASGLVGAVGGGGAAAKTAGIAVGATSATSALRTLGTVGTVAFAGIGYESVKAAMSFDQTVTRLQTQAGATAAQLKVMSDGVRALSGQTATGPNALASAIYEVASAGYKGADAVTVMKQAALGAKVGNADLTETTSSLVAAMKALNVPAADATSTMASLNAIVGAGKMTMDQLNAALGTGIIPTAQSFGVSLDSVGSALAYMTDRGTPADQAATKLRMTMSLLADPTARAAKALGAIGLAGPDVKAATQDMANALAKANVTTSKMASDLRQPDGIQVALVDLKSHLETAGLSANAASAVLARAFGGGKSDAAILELIQNVDGLKQKFGQVGTGASQFGQDVAATQKTAAYQVAQLKANIENLGVSIGQKLLPDVAALTGWMSRNKAVMLDLVEVMGGIAVVKIALLAVSLGQNLVGALTKASKAVLGLKVAEEEANSAGGLAAGFSRALPVLAPVAIGIGAITYALHQQHEQAKQNAAAFAAMAQSATQDFQPSVVQSLGQLNAQFTVAKGNLKTLFDQQVKATEAFTQFGLGAKVAKQATDAYNTALASLKTQQENFTTTANWMAQAAGVTVPQALQLAQQAGIDLANTTHDTATAALVQLGAVAITTAQQVVAAVNTIGSSLQAGQKALLGHSAAVLPTFTLTDVGKNLLGITTPAVPALPDLGDDGTGTYSPEATGGKTKKAKVPPGPYSGFQSVLKLFGSDTEGSAFAKQAGITTLAQVATATKTDEAIRKLAEAHVKHAQTLVKAATSAKNKKDATSLLSTAHSQLNAVTRQLIKVQTDGKTIAAAAAKAATELADAQLEATSNMADQATADTVHITEAAEKLKADTKGTVTYYQDLAAYNQAVATGASDAATAAQQAKADQIALQNAIVQAGIDYSDPLSSLRAAVTEAQNTLNGDTTNTTQWFLDTSALHQAQQQLTDAIAQNTTATVTNTQAMQPFTSTTPGYVALRAGADSPAYLGTGGSGRSTSAQPNVAIQMTVVTNDPDVVAEGLNVRLSRAGSSVRL